MILFKACKRCNGDMYDAVDIYGPYWECIQCGHMIDVPDARLAKAEAEGRALRAARIAAKKAVPAKVPVPVRVAA